MHSSPETQVLLSPKYNKVIGNGNKQILKGGISNYSAHHRFKDKDSRATCQLGLLTGVWAQIPSFTASLFCPLEDSLLSFI